MGNPKTTGELWLELLAALAVLGARLVLGLGKALLVLAGPSLVVTLILIAFGKVPAPRWNDLEVAAYFLVVSALIGAWLCFIVRPFVNDSLPPGRTIGNVLAGWVTGLATGMRRR